MRHTLTMLLMAVALTTATTDAFAGGRKSSGRAPQGNASVSVKAEHPQCTNQMRSRRNATYIR